MAKSSPKWVENTVGKTEFARNKQFLLFPQCFEKLLPLNKLSLGIRMERGTLLYCCLSNDRLLPFTVKVYEPYLYGKGGA